MTYVQKTTLIAGLVLSSASQALSPIKITGDIVNDVPGSGEIYMEGTRDQPSATAHYSWDLIYGTGGSIYITARTPKKNPNVDAASQSPLTVSCEIAPGASLHKLASRLLPQFQKGAYLKVRSVNGQCLYISLQRATFDRE